MGLATKECNKSFSYMKISFSTCSTISSFKNITSKYLQHIVESCLVTFCMKSIKLLLSIYLLQQQCHQVIILLLLEGVLS